VPGLIIFGSLFAVFSTAMLLVRESTGGTLARLKLTRLSARELLAGVALASLAASLVQMPLTFGVAVATGFETQGSLWLALLVGTLSSFSAIGLGLIVACFAKNDSETGSLGAGAGVPMAFLSGAIFPLPPAPLGQIAGHEVEVYDLLPTTHAAEAMRRILVNGDGARELGYELVALTMLSFVVFAVGVALWRRLRLDRA
jgi:ABC-2 type transport system permease protein